MMNTAKVLGYQPMMRQVESAIITLATAVTCRLRMLECPHGLPYAITSRDPIEPWGEGATCRPLCDACVMEAVREVLRGVERDPSDPVGVANLIDSADSQLRDRRR